MKFSSGMRLFCLTWATLVAAGCSEVGVQHVPVPSRIQVSPENVTIYLANEGGNEELFPSSAQLSARVFDSAGGLLSGDAAKVSWDPLDTAVAQVDAAGRVTAVGTGSATIRSMAVGEPSLQATVSVTVLDAGRADVVVR